MGTLRYNVEFEFFPSSGESITFRDRGSVGTSYSKSAKKIFRVADSGSAVLYDSGDSMETGGEVGFFILSTKDATLSVTMASSSKLRIPLVANLPLVTTGAFDGWGGADDGSALPSDTIDTITYTNNSGATAECTFVVV